MELKKSDLQNFFKKLRNNHPKTAERISYYAVGEYGTNNLRPHYHIILFGCTDSEITKAWTSDARGGKQPEPLGEIYFGRVEGPSIGYTLKYISKAKAPRLHQRDDRRDEFALMSKKIGANYITPAMVKYHHADLQNRVCVQIEEKKISMPKYLKEKIYTPEQKGELKGYFEFIAPTLEEEHRKKEYPQWVILDTDSESEKRRKNFLYYTTKMESHKWLSRKYQILQQNKNNV